MLPEVGELVFSLVVGYMGALEFFYVVRHLYHWSFRHNPEMRDLKGEADSLQKLQDHLRNSISEATDREALGLKAMKDGVLYKDGFRVNGDQKEIDDLNEKVRTQEQAAKRRKEIEEELARQKKIEEETRRKLKEAEEQLQREMEEKIRQQRAEEEENARRIREAELRKEEEQRRKEEEEARQRQEEEENSRKLIEEEKRREEQQRLKELEEEENARRLLEAEKEREALQRQQEIDEENTRKLLQAEREREELERLRELEEEKKAQEEFERQQELKDQEIIERLLRAEREREEEEENARRLLEAEREREEAQRLLELEEENARRILEAERELQAEQRRIEEDQARQRQEEEENYRRLLQMEREMEERERLAEEEKQALLEHAAALEKETAERLFAAEREAELKRRQLEENEENIRNLLEAERELELKKQEMEREAENLRLLIEAEKEMEERQRKLDTEALQKFKEAQEEVQLHQAIDLEAGANEQPFEKRNIHQSEAAPTQTVKTQFGQTAGDSMKSKTLHFPGVSEESSSAEPLSSNKSSFSTEASSEDPITERNLDELERQAPDGGEDMPSLQYSDDYLRSLDGIKNKPLVREDGSGRRRAFKKRRSSGSSTSSRESRASREEELKMFTSLEEEELESIRKGESEYDAIKYASEPNLKVGRQNRRHKRSPAKDTRSDGAKGSLEMLNEEDTNPWGDIKPEHHKDGEYWKKEKHQSIDEELGETEANQTEQLSSPSAANIPKMSSFEDATKSQHEEAISVLQRQRSKDPETTKEPETESETKNVSTTGAARQSPRGRNSSPASASASVSPAIASPKPKRTDSLEPEDASSTGGGLRRSPRVDEMQQYKENWKSEERKARVEAGENPAIEIDCPSDEEQEYLMEGISDFYDFNASINPSRSRSRTRSRSLTPAKIRSVSPIRRTPSLQNLSHHPATKTSRSPSPDPASYKFIYERILPSLAADQEEPRTQAVQKLQEMEHADGISDFYDFNSKLNRDAPPGVSKRRSSTVHRTSVDYVMEDLKDERQSRAGAISKRMPDLQHAPPSPEYERSISADWRDIQKLKEELISGTFKRSTYVGESMDFSDQFESLREEAKTFRRSRSRSRSPVYDINEMAANAMAKKQLQDKILEDIVKASKDQQAFEYDVNKSTIDRNRRASDTALIQKPEILFQMQELIQESDECLDVLELEPEEYHHFRRFSLNQETPVDTYPEDYVCISEIEVKSLGDLRLVAPAIEVLAEAADKQQEEVVEEAYESGSEDERQTVVEVEDEIDEDLWDYNERPEESHNEQSECEEADREIDRYADRQANDWHDIEGAVGGVLDEDSFQIDQIYGEAIKNRKPSGILRDYDCILKEIQVSEEDHLEEEIRDKIPLIDEPSGGMERGLWSPRNRSSRGSSRESSMSFLENERRENERQRYLGDATMEAIQSTRLRSRYGIVPSTSFNATHDDIEVDINYVPRKEYNWRKNFKLDDDDGEETHTHYLDPRKLSLGGESITLFSRSPDHSEEEKELSTIPQADEDMQEQLEEEMEQEPEELSAEKPAKKRRSKKKSRKGSKGSIGESVDENEKRTIAAPDDASPSKKSCLDIGERAVQDEMETDGQQKKKSKKRRKAKQEPALPSLDIKLPSPEQKKPPPSVAAIRAAFSTQPTDAKLKSPTPVSPSSDISSSSKLTPTEQKKPPPSVAAIRAAFSAPTTDTKVTTSGGVSPDSKLSSTKTQPPTDQKKTPPSVAAIRASLSAQATDIKVKSPSPSSTSPTSVKNRSSPEKAQPSTAAGALQTEPIAPPKEVTDKSPAAVTKVEPAADNTESRLSDSTKDSAQPESIPSATQNGNVNQDSGNDHSQPQGDQNPTSPSPKPVPTLDVKDILKDGGLYPLF